MAVPQFKPSRISQMLSAVDRHSAPESFASLSDDITSDLDEAATFASLDGLISAGAYRLDRTLGIIADVARQLTDASGTALAMWKDGLMVCRARGGESGPALGSQLIAKAGISGECLRTGKIQSCTDTENDPVVDLEVCRRLGLRSIAVVPIQGWRGINGILEVFSTEPAAFNERHSALLQELAALAERARSSQPQDASPPDRRVAAEKRQAADF
jgi:hypothetical protein